MKKIIILLLITPIFFCNEINLKWDINQKIEITPINESVELIIDVENMLELGYYYNDLSVYVNFPVDSVERVEGKKCSSITVEKVGNNSKITCTFRGLFMRGNKLKLKISGECNCSLKTGVDLFVFPMAWGMGKNQEGRFSTTVLVPKEYLVENITLKNYSEKETDSKREIKYSAYLLPKENLEDVLGKSWMHFRKKITFGKIKTKKVSKFIIIYPSEIEEEIEEMVSDLNDALPIVENYGNVSLPENITIVILPNRSIIGEYGGEAYVKNFTIFLPVEYFGRSHLHELCHLIEAPYDFPPWFSEGEATNCEVMLYQQLGKKYPPKYGENQDYMYFRKLRFYLEEWVPPEVYIEETTRTDMGYNASYLLFKELLSEVQMPKLMKNIRDTFLNFNQEIGTKALICIFENTALYSRYDILFTFENWDFITFTCNDLALKIIELNKKVRNKFLTRMVRENFNKGYFETVKTLLENEDVFLALDKYFNYFFEIFSFSESLTQ